jgi:hypothetical protein
MTSAQSNTNGSPSANSALTKMTLTKPIERKGCFSTSVTRSRKPTTEFVRRRIQERSTHPAYSQSQRLR